MTTTRKPAVAAALKPFTIVTGGSDGIGRAIARRFAGQGTCLLLIARGEDRLAAAAAELRDGFRCGRAHPAAGYHLTRCGRRRSTRRSRARAAMPTSSSTMPESGCRVRLRGRREADVERLLDLNIKAMTMLTHHVLPGMRQRHAGGMINLASLGGYAPGPWQAVYYASKAYVLSFSEAIAAEVAATGCACARSRPVRSTRCFTNACGRKRPGIASCCRHSHRPPWPGGPNGDTGSVRASSCPV